MTKTTQPNRIIADIWASFVALPLWVQGWMALVLAPVNMLSVVFINEPMGGWIAGLAVAGVLPNIGSILYDRGFSRLTAVVHIVPWTLLLILLLVAGPIESSASFDYYLYVLLSVNLVSLIWDYPDAVKWFRGERQIFGR